MSSSRPAFRNKPMAQVKLKVLLRRVRLFATRWTVAHQASLFMGFSRQEYWSGFLCPLLQGIFMTERLRCNRKYEHKAQQKPSYQAPPRCEWIKFFPRTPAPCSHAAPSCWHPPHLGIPGRSSEWRPSCPWHAGCQFGLSSSSSLSPVHHPSGPHCSPWEGQRAAFSSSGSVLRVQIGLQLPCLVMAQGSPAAILCSLDPKGAGLGPALAAHSQCLWMTLAILVHLTPYFGREQNAFCKHL